MKSLITPLLTAALLAGGLAAQPEDFEIRTGLPVEAMEGEVHFKNLRQLTFVGENAEAYWSFDGTKLVFQRKHEFGADQIYVLDLVTGERTLVSTGLGATTCAYFLKGDKEVVFASTHGGDPRVPKAVRVIKGKYVWPIFGDYDVWKVGIDGKGLTRLTDTPGYDAEATVDPVTGNIVFTSMRNGDLDLYSMAPDGSNVKQLTNRLGYDGGAFYSPDGKKLLQRSGFFANDEERDQYVKLLKDGYVMPSKMELTWLNVDGGDIWQITDNGKANFAPFWHPSGEKLLFSSNQDAPRGRDFEIYMIGLDGENQKRITYNPSFDGFPMFSPNGKYLVFASNRYSAIQGNTNLFICEWVENPKPLEKTSLEISGDDTMKFDQTELKAKVGQITLKLTNEGKLPKQAMGHNFVLLKPGVDPMQFGMKCMQRGGSLENGYLPGSVRDEVVASTKLLGPGESDTITFKIKEPGSYPFVCTFPGHMALMKGTLIVE